MNKKVISIIFVILASIVGIGLYVSQSDKSDAVIHKFKCKDTLIEVQLYPFEEGGTEYKEIALKATRGRKQTVLWFQNGIFAADCIKSKSGKDYIIFQKYCSGSGCIDGNNWGIIDPESLSILLLPHYKNFILPKEIDGKAYGEMNPLYEENKREVKKILGYYPNQLETYD